MVGDRVLKEDGLIFSRPLTHPGARTFSVPAGVGIHDHRVPLIWGTLNPICHAQDRQAQPTTGDPARSSISHLLPGEQSSTFHFFYSNHPIRVDFMKSFVIFFRIFGFKGVLKWKLNI